MKILRIVGVIIVLLFIGALVLLPRNLDVKAEKVIDVPVETVFPLIAGIPNWLRWSPWELADSTRLFDFTQGDSQSYIGGKGVWTTLLPNSSDGRYEVVDTKVNQYVVVDVYFDKVSKDERAYRFRFDLVVVTETGQPQTKVTWTMTDTADFFKIQDRIQIPGMIEGLKKQFEEGLENLSKLSAEEDLFLKFPRIDLQPNLMTYMIYSEIETEPMFENIDKYFTANARPIFDFIDGLKLRFREPPVVRIPVWDTKSNKAVLQYGFVITPEQKNQIESILPKNMKIADIASPGLMNATIIMPDKPFSYYDNNLVDYIKLKKFNIVGDRILRIMHNPDMPTMPKHYVLMYPIIANEKIKMSK